jgi:hypothetical protein
VKYFGGVGWWYLACNVVDLGCWLLFDVIVEFIFREFSEPATRIQQNVNVLACTRSPAKDAMLFTGTGP